MGDDLIRAFKNERERLQTQLQELGNVDIRRFLGIDNSVYRDGSIDSRTKEMLGFTASLVLRCDDCINYHLAKLKESGITDEQFMEILSVCMVIGGSITIPHARRAVDAWLNYSAEENDARGSGNIDEGGKMVAERVEFDEILMGIEKIAHGDTDWETKLKEITRLLKESVGHYDWVGFYFVDPDNERELALGPFSGEHTEHTRIRFGSGICGQVAESQKPMVIQNVSDENNYLSCSPYVKSEIVLPVFVEGRFVGELDIDSHTPEPFTGLDKEFLGRVCEVAATIIGKNGF